MNNTSFSRFVRIPLRFALVGCFLCVLAGCDTFIRDFVPDESGFDGAITVIEARRDGLCGVVTVRVPFLDIYGAPRVGKARMVIHRSQTKQAATVPAFCHVHYEMGVDGAKKWAERGWAVFTAVYDEEAPIAVSMGDGNNQARAIIQWAQRLPFIDGARLHLDGGSQGGYMALAMSADLFPVTSTTADAPVANWAYNFAYFEANRSLVAGYPSPMESPLPVMASVLQLADMSYEHFPRDLTHDTWFHLSPISQTARIANPVMVTIATGDMLVPMEQITAEHLHPHDPAKFPEGYARDFEGLAPSDKTRARLQDLPPPESVFSAVMPLQENSYVVTTAMRLGAEERPDKRPESTDRPWSREHQWNFCYLDEGSPEPFADHTTWAWDTVPDSFVAYYQETPPGTEILNAAKLERLLERYTGNLSNLPALNNGAPVNRRNFEYVEKRDVLHGLIAYAELGPVYEERLIALYNEASLKPFGAQVTLDALRHTFSELKP